MRLAVWDIRPCSLLFGSNDVHGIDVLYRKPGECKALLDSGEVDVALVAVNEVLRDVDEYNILPQAVIASTATFPYATLWLKGGVDGIRSVKVFEDHRQAGEVAEIILREEYGLEGSVRFGSVPSTNGSSPDAHVTFKDPTGDLEVDNRWLDIGQEWFELTSLPLVWGVFTVPARSEAGSTFGDQMEAVVSGLELEGCVSGWLDAHPAMTSRERSALEGDLRFRFDDEVLAGLDVLAQYLFYYGKVDDIPTPRFSRPPESLRPADR